MYRSTRPSRSTTVHHCNTICLHLFAFVCVVLALVCICLHSFVQYRCAFSFIYICTSLTTCLPMSALVCVGPRMSSPSFASVCTRLYNIGAILHFYMHVHHLQHVCTCLHSFVSVLACPFPRLHPSALVCAI